MKKRYSEKNGKRIVLARLAKFIDEIDKALEKKQAIEELGEYSSEINSVITDYNRKSAEETMMIKGYRKSSQETTNRKTHQENLANVAIRIAKAINKTQRKLKGTGLNCEIIETMARNHDIGHTFLGHSGEWWLSNIKEDYGIGYYCHNALGPRELIYTTNIYDEIIETIKQSHPEINNKTLNRIRSNLWIIIEGINSHNGERSEYEYMPDFAKTKEDFERENLYCFTKKGYDRQIIPATPEAALMRLCDKISYIPYDMVDGLREKIIPSLNEEYRVVLRKLGITDEEIEECAKTNHYEKIARKLQTIFINDVIQHSTGATIRMSNKMSDLLHMLRNINNKQIVNFVVLKEDNETYPPALRELMDRFEEVITSENILTKLKSGEISGEDRKQLIEKYKDTPYEEFIQYTCNTNSEDFAYTMKIVEEATKQSIYDEQEKAREIVAHKEPFTISKDFKLRDARIQKYISYYEDKDISQYSEEDKQKDVEIVLNNIINPKRQSVLYLNMNRRIALELGAKYLATLNDIEFMDLLKQTGFVNEVQYDSLTRKYKDINLHDEVYIQENWKEIATEQAKEIGEK